MEGLARLKKASEFELEAELRCVVFRPSCWGFHGVLPWVQYTCYPQRSSKRQCDVVLTPLPPSPAAARAGLSCHPILRLFYKTELVPLWPKGWMTVNELRRTAASHKRPASKKSVAAASAPPTSTAADQPLAKVAATADPALGAAPEAKAGGAAEASGAPGGGHTGRAVVKAKKRKAVASEHPQLAEKPQTPTGLSAGKRDGAATGAGGAKKSRGATHSGRTGTAGSKGAKHRPTSDSRADDGADPAPLQGAGPAIETPAASPTANPALASSQAVPSAGASVLPASGSSGGALSPDLT